MGGAWKAEPVVIVQFVAALLTVGIAFGMPITDAQREAVLQFVGVLAPIVIAATIMMRQNVFAPDTVEGIKTAAAKQVIAADQNGYESGYAAGVAAATKGV